MDSGLQLTPAARKATLPNKSEYVEVRHLHAVVVNTDVVIEKLYILFIDICRSLSFRVTFVLIII